MEIQAGDYLTRDGTRASVYQWGKNGIGVECWVGTVQGGGYNCWSLTGEDLAGTREWDLVAPFPKSEKSVPASVRLNSTIPTQGGTFTRKLPKQD
jgi:hypothetical protein